MNGDPHAAEALAIWNLLGEYSWRWLVERFEESTMAGDRFESRRIERIALHIHKLGG